MPAILRNHVSYANVVATLALFIALGGTSYAALKITSRDIVNRTIKGGDVAKNTLGGTEIKESRLKTVPSAQRATSAAAADVSKNADHATQATVADTATAAASAANAQQLAGQAASAYEKSSRTQFGTASAAPANGGTEAAVLSWPELGVTLTNATDAHAGCGGQLAIGIKNTKASGGTAAQVFALGQGSIGTVNAAGTGYFCSNSGSDNFAFELTDASARTLYVNCIVASSDNQMRCFATRSEP